MIHFQEHRSYLLRRRLVLEQAGPVAVGQQPDLVLGDGFDVLDAGAEQLILEQATVRDTIAGGFPTVALLFARLGRVFVRFGAERGKVGLPVVVCSVGGRKRKLRPELCVMLEEMVCAVETYRHGMNRSSDEEDSPPLKRLRATGLQCFRIRFS